MFTICAAESVNISPCEQGKRAVQDSSCQTEVFLSEMKEIQEPVKKGKKIQTDISERRKASTSEFDPEALLQFLNRVTPDICRFLESNRNSHAFDRYTLLTDDDVTATEKTHTLKNRLPKDEFICADVSWNAVGSALAVAYSSRKHTAWCDHDSLIAIWNLDRKDFNAEKPHTVIESDGCVTAIAFHPSLPPIIAGGKFDGTVYIWNIAKDDDMLLASTDSLYSAHREPITSLVWTPGPKNKLISCGLDGKILLWKYSEKQTSLELQNGFVVLAEQLARSLGIRSVRPGAEVGVTCLSLNTEDPSLFIIGTEGGGVFQCSLNSTTAVHYPQSQSLPLKSPIEVHHQKNSGHTTSVHFSPFSRNIFLTSSSGGELKVFSALKAAPVITIKLDSSILKAAWSVVRPLVISAVTVNGNLCIFDLHVSHTEPIEVIAIADEEKVGFTTVVFNEANENLLATGCRDGDAHVWKLGSSLTSVEADELEELKSLVTLD